MATCMHEKRHCLLRGQPPNQQLERTHFRDRAWCIGFADCRTKRLRYNVPLNTVLPTLSQE